MGLDGCGNGMREREVGEAGWMKNWVKIERREWSWMEAGVRYGIEEAARLDG